MLTIWKLVLTPASESLLTFAHEQEAEVPADAEFLCAWEQRGSVCLWFRCDSEAPKAIRRIFMCPTGGPAPPAITSRYLGTARLADGLFVLHVFEMI